MLSTLALYATTLKSNALVYQCVPSHCHCHPVKYSPASGLCVRFHSVEEKNLDILTLNNSKRYIKG